MRLPAILLIGLTRLLIVWPLLLLRWAVDFAWDLVFALVRTLLYLGRLLIGTALRPLGHRFVLIAVAVAVVIAAAVDPRLQNPGFYGVFTVSLLACFFAGRFGRLMLPRTAPDFTGMFPSLPGLPRWPPFPKARPRVTKAKLPADIAPRPRAEPRMSPPPTMPVRPLPSAVHVVAVHEAVPSPSEEEVVAALPEALRRLMRPKESPVTAGTAAQETGGRPSPG